MPRKPRTKNHLNVWFDVDKKKASIKKRVEQIKEHQIKIDFLQLHINTYYLMNHKLLSKESEKRNIKIAKYCEKLLKEIKKTKNE